MFLGIYRFEGEANELCEAYDRLLDNVPHSNLNLHACVVDAGGLTVFDTCPSEEAFMSFASGPEFKAALQASGLPIPHVTPMGEVHAAFVSGKRVC